MAILPKGQLLTMIRKRVRLPTVRADVDYMLFFIETLHNLYKLFDYVYLQNAWCVDEFQPVIYPQEWFAT